MCSSAEESPRECRDANFGAAMLFTAISTKPISNAVRAATWYRATLSLSASAPSQSVGAHCIASWLTTTIWVARLLDMNGPSVARSGSRLGHGQAENQVAAARSAVMVAAATVATASVTSKPERRAAK